MIAIVVATDKNRVIGSENRIPWRIKSDLKRLRSLTLGNPVILGRKTYESMDWYYNRSGRQMPGGVYIVLTRDASYKPSRQNAQAVNSIPQALEVAKQQGGKDIFIIGGDSVFKAMLSYADRIYWTEVMTDTPGDAYFPKLTPGEWRELYHEHYEQNEYDEYDSDLIVLEKIKK